MANSESVIYGNALLYSTPWDDKVTFPDDDTDFGVAWGKPDGQTADWTERGYTQDGIGVAMDVTRAEIGADQVLDPLFRPVTARNVQISTQLIEITAEHFNLGLGQGSVTSKAPDSSNRGYDEFDLTATVTDQYNAWGVDVEKPQDGEPFRIIMWKGLAEEGVDTTFGNQASAAQIAVGIAAVPDDSGESTRILTIRDYKPATGGGA